MHENRNQFLFLIKINNMQCTAPDTFYQYPGPVFGTGADGAAGAVFLDIAVISSQYRSVAYQHRSNYCLVPTVCIWALRIIQIVICTLCLKFTGLFYLLIQLVWAANNGRWWLQSDRSISVYSGKSLVLIDSRQKFGWLHWIPTRPIFTWGELVTGANWQWGELTANRSIRSILLVEYNEAHFW